MNSTQKINVVTKIIVILALCRFIEIAQRIFKFSDTHYISLTPDKILNSLIIERYSMSTYTGVTNCQNSPVFLAHPVDSIIR